MKFTPTQHTLKSGMDIIIRIPTMSEAQQLVDLKRSYIENTTTLPLTLDEYPDDPETESLKIQEYENSHNSILLVAEHNGNLIGNIDITGSKRSKIAHTGMLGMGIQEAWRNQGLGKILINNAIKWCKENSPIKIIWLEVYASNDLGYHLYLKTGFEVDGKVTGFFKERGLEIDKIMMSQKI